MIGFCYQKMLTALGSVYVLKPVQTRWPAIFESPIQKMESSLDDLELGSEILKVEQHNYM